MANTEKQIRNYVVRQRNWIKANNLKPGDRVLVRKNHLSFSKGWNNGWYMNQMVGKILRVERIYQENNPSSGIQLEGAFGYPYTVLQKIYS